MKNKLFVFLSLSALCIIVFSGCTSSKPIDSSEIDQYVVSQTSDETVQEDFVFRLVSEKEIYQKGEDVDLYGEITYIGEEDNVTIHHSSSAILFPITEKTREYTIGFGVNDIGLSTTLENGEPYRENYDKYAVGYDGSDPEDYRDFIQDITNMDGFLPGYYAVNGTTDFFLKEGGQERIEINAMVDFKVVN